MPYIYTHTRDFGVLSGLNELFLLRVFLLFPGVLGDVARHSVSLKQQKEQSLRRDQ